jgi:Domain of unknown function (DUF1943)/Lipoprotein amino terminal region
MNFRAAAVFAIMRTNPPALMLQRMAGMTNVEKSQNVASAVKTALQSAAELEHPDDQELAENANAAVKLLDSDVPAAQDSRTMITDFIMEELNLGYKMQASSIGSDDSMYPKAAFLRTTKNVGGYKNNWNEYFAMVSSVDQLFEMIAERMRSNGPRKNQDNDKRRKPQHPNFGHPSRTS